MTDANPAATEVSPLLFAMLQIVAIQSSHGPLSFGHHSLLYITSGSGRLEMEALPPVAPRSADARDERALPRSGITDITDVHHELTGGSCWLLPPGAAYRLSCTESDILQGWRLDFVGIRLASPESTEVSPDREVLFPYEGGIDWRDQPELGAMLRSLVEGSFGSSLAGQLERQRLFLELLGRIAQIVRPESEPVQLPSGDDPLEKTEDAADAARAGIARTIDYMKQAYDREVTRDRLAQIAGMSPGYYSSMFRKETGQSPMEKLAAIRLEQAKTLLLFSDSPLREIARAVGYSSEFYFSSRFKQMTGLSPSAYAERNRENQIVSSRAYTTYLRASQPESARLRERPERIVGLFLEDPLLVLGVKPLLQYVWSGYSQTYLQPYIADVEPFDVGHLDFALLRRAEPDVILLGFTTFASEGNYDRFAEIAPTFAFRQAEMDWRTTLRSLGALIGRVDEASQAIERYERLALTAREQLAARVGTETVALLRLHFKNGLCLYGGPHSYTAPVLYRDLGLRMPPLLEGWSRRGKPPVMPIAPETLVLLDADHLFLVVDDSRREEAEKLLESPLWKELRAVRSGRVYTGTTDVWMTFGMIAHERKIRHVLDALAPSPKVRSKKY